MSPAEHRPPAGDSWPALDYPAWKDTLETLHLWTQIVGKVRLARSPWINHSWQATLYVDGRGLTTGLVPHGRRSFEIAFDLVDHVLKLQVVDGPERRIPLEPRSVASFHAAVLGTLEEIGLPVRIHGSPNEVTDPIPFAGDETHASYDPESANRFWRALVQSDRVFTWFRAGFRGKVSPVHLFWGALDLAVTRFSGREAPLHPGGIPNLPDRVTREAYSHEVSSAGFWAGNETVPYAAYYSYAYPSPAGFEAARVEPGEATWNDELGEYLLPYDVVRTAPDPDAVLRRFLASTYEAAAVLGEWDRTALECGREPPTDAEWSVPSSDASDAPEQSDT